ncbi:MAG: hypothetical protein ABFQ65_00470 [Nanoarchaeota archaeon]
MKIKKTFGVCQVMILLLGIVAISYAVGSEVGVVEATEGDIINFPGDPYIYRYSGNTYEYKKLDGSGWKTINTKGKEELNRRLGISQTSSSGQNPNLGLSGTPNPASFNDIPSQPSAGFETPGDYPIAPLQETGTGGAGTDTPGESSSSPSWYESFLGKSGSETFTLSGDEYEGKNYYKDKGNWMYTKDGVDAKVENKAELGKLENNEGTVVGGAGFMDTAQYLLAGYTLAAGVKTIIIAAGGGEEDKKAVAIGEGLEKGIQAGTTVNAIMKIYNKGYSGNAGTYIGFAVAVWYIINHYKDLEDKSVTFECSVWEAPSGGSKCSECNNEIFGCSEYQCKSLGKGCELLNPGSEEELCTWINRNDAEAPQIRPWEDALNEDFVYTPDNAQSPPDRGVIIRPVENQGDEQGCISAYTPLKFGVSLDEPATCKIDTERKDNYEEMSFYFGSNSLARYNHSHTMILPSIGAIGPVIKEGTNMSLFVRCEDANGNSNTGEFIFKFCVEEGEDFTAPLIVDTSIPNNAPVAYNISNTSLTAYINEPADCKWDFIDKGYNLMENDFDCSSNFEVRNAQTVYPCSTTLTGLKDREENNYYFRCNDTSGNTNKESTKLTLIGTQPLYIDFAEPNGTTVKDATSPVQVLFEIETSSGAEDGKAFCSYKPLGTLSYVQFLYNPVEMTYQHTQELNLADGNYAYSIMCVDAGGNAVFEDITFDVETDIGSPVVIRAYKEDGYLKLITDESGMCVYNTQEDIGCRYEFEDGIELQTVDEDEHFIEWDSQETFYVKCKDEFGNPPLPSDCSIIARPSSEQVL